MLVAVSNDYRQAVIDSLPWLFGALVAIGVMAWMIVRIRTWFGDDADRMGCEQDLLTQLRDVHEEGQLSDEEFRSIKGRIAKTMTAPSSAGDDTIPLRSRTTQPPINATPTQKDQAASPPDAEMDSP